MGPQRRQRAAPLSGREGEPVPAGRAAAPPHAVTQQDPHDHREGDRDQRELVDQAEQNAHVQVDDPVGHLGHERPLGEVEPRRHRARGGVDDDRVVLRRPVTLALGDLPALRAVLGAPDEATDVVIDENTRKTLFADSPRSPVGQVLLIGNVLKMQMPVHRMLLHEQKMRQTRQHRLSKHL